MGSCETLTQLLNALSSLDPERYYVSLDEGGDVGIALTTFIASIDNIRRIVCGEIETVMNPCRDIENFLNFLWMLKWRNGVARIFPFDKPGPGVDLRKVSYLTGTLIPRYAIRVDPGKIVEMARELYDIYSEVCRAKSRVRQTVVEIVGGEIVARRSRGSRKRSVSRSRREEVVESDNESASDSTEIVHGDSYEVVSDDSIEVVG